MKRTSGKRWISLVLALCLCLLVGCGGKQTGYDPLKGVETRMITDSAGRQVEIPAEITRIAPSGSTAQMILMPVAYDLLVGLSSSPSTAQMSYFPEEMRYLPTFGQFYGSKASLNMESLIAAQPQLIIDLGDAKDSIAEDMDTIQKQTGIPTIFIEADLDDMAAAYRMLGDILGRQEQAEELAQFIDRTVTMAQTNAAAAALEELGIPLVQERRHSDTPMCANVDMYSGLVYTMLDIPEDVFTPLFASARIAGWCANRIEELVTCRRIMRPAYRAMLIQAPYIPVDART